MAQVLGGCRCPSVVRAGILEAEAGQEVITIQSGSLSQQGGADRGVLRRAALRDPRLKLSHIEPDVRLVAQSDGFPVCRDPSLSQRLLDIPQDLAQVFIGFGLLVIGPE